MTRPSRRERCIRLIEEVGVSWGKPCPAEFAKTHGWDAFTDEAIEDFAEDARKRFYRDRQWQAKLRACYVAASAASAAERNAA